LFLFKGIEMTPTDVSRVAGAIYNMALARGTASVVTIVAHAVTDVIKQVRAQCAANGVTLELRNDDFDFLSEALQPRILDGLIEAEAALSGTGLADRFHAKLCRVKETLEPVSFDAIKAGVRIEDLCHELFEELGAPLFLQMSSAKRSIYERAASAFGTDVDTQFPEAGRDIQAAGQCLALDQWTASVFHSMRILEHGLRPFATRFGVPFEHDSWHKVIKGIEDGIGRLRTKQGLSNDDRELITNYSKAAAEFRYFKDAWRNHVAHGRGHYDESEATQVYEHVRTFMAHMVTILAVR
jgi:hypothetical protein